MTSYHSVVNVKDKAELEGHKELDEEFGTIALPYSSLEGCSQPPHKYRVKARNVKLKICPVSN